MDVFERENESYFTIQKWNKIEPLLQVGFTTKQGGVSKEPFTSLNLGLHVSDNKHHVLENRKILANKICLQMGSWVCGEQVHGTNVQVVDSTVKGNGAFDYKDSLSGIDGLITKQKGILCTAFFADCVPLFFFDPKTNLIGIAHAGWKGTVNGIGKKMVDKFNALGSDISSLLVAIGPCISKEAYEVDNHVIKNLTPNQKLRSTEERENNHYLLDLKQLNVEILLQSGVLRRNIDITNYCTFHDEDTFFSHRRDYGKTGRMLGFIGFQP